MGLMVSLEMVAISMGFMCFEALLHEVIQYAWVLRDFLEIVGISMGLMCLFK